MNKNRRAVIETAIKLLEPYSDECGDVISDCRLSKDTILNLEPILTAVKLMVEQVLKDEEETYYRIPDNLWSSENAINSESAIADLKEGLIKIDALVQKISTAKHDSTVEFGATPIYDIIRNLESVFI